MDDAFLVDTYASERFKTLSVLDPLPTNPPALLHTVAGLILDRSFLRVV